MINYNTMRGDSMHNRFGVMMTAATFALLGFAVSSAHACGMHTDWPKLATLPGAWVLNIHASLAIAAVLIAGGGLIAAKDMVWRKTPLS